MLQNPSKYHTNPLSHFLALHNSQVAYNARNNNNSSNNSSNNNSSNNVAAHMLTNVSAFGLNNAIGGHGQFQHHHNQNLNHHHHQQQQQQQHSQQQQQQHHQLLLQQSEHTSAQHVHNLHGTTHAHQQHAQFLEASAATTLDVGKSFTIAAILGLQSRNGLEHNSRKDYNSVINLSLNASNDNENNQQSGQQGEDEKISSTTPPPPPPARSKDETLAKIVNNNNKNHNNNNNNSLEQISSDKNNKADNHLTISPINKLYCDSSNGLISSYLANAATPNAGSASTFGQQHQQQQQQPPSHHLHSLQQQSHHHHQNQHHHHHHLLSSHVRANSFAAAAAVAAVAAANVNAVVNGTPSALQSLQQLHQHHAQQSNLSFTREKIKAESHSKKSALKNKRVRTIFTPEQLERLEAEFERQQYMVGPERLYLAHTLQLTEAQVKVWFQNRRIKWRKHHLELTQQRLALLRQNQLPSSTNAGGVNLSSLPSPDNLATAASNSSFDENDESDLQPKTLNSNLTQQSPTESDSELSVCNDSMDDDSINDGGGGGGGCGSVFGDLTES